MTEQNLVTLYEKTLSEQEHLTELQKSVLKAALKLFSSQGFEATSTSQIAREAGVASGSVYKQFKNKKELLRAVLAPLFQGTLQTVVNELADETLNKKYPSLDEFVQAVVRDRFYFIQENFPAIQLLLSQILTNEDFRGEVQVFFAQQFEHMLSPVLSQYQTNQEMNKISYDNVVQLVFGTFISYFGKLLFGLAGDVEKEIEESSQLLLLAFRPQK
ncbi:TetR/AcrR family transcriptional regulator [Lactococcus sp.]|uniref:TetR/AcrR family transcriptional regulator n=1 Tax=Lactococcus sp. TaxID=44273 RepID=UPI0035AE308E